MRVSNDQLQKQASALAESFLQAQEQKPGWSYQVISVLPDKLAARHSVKKAVIKWAVVVEWSHNGHVIDGPAVLQIDLLTKRIEPYV
jgi:hypothetical protein